MKERIPAVLLAGGLGTRIREETEFKPKPMVEIGGKPILWHIMKNLSHFEIDEFIICGGYKGEVIKNYFLNYDTGENDFTIDLSGGRNIEIHSGLDSRPNWRVTVADTGALTPTGGRIKKVEKYIAGRRFFATYGDGLSDIELDGLMEFHLSHGKIATVSTARPLSRFGVVDIDDSGRVVSFREKPIVDDWVNIGFFIFEPEVLDYLKLDSVLEQEPLAQLASDGELFAYQHEGFWQPMDTYREMSMLNELWETCNAPWKNW
jgi:glucose-1-phosphate cytidylyltransferase